VIESSSYKGPERRKSTAAAASHAAASIEQALWREFFDAKTAQSFCQSWLNLQCGLIAKTVRGVVVMGAPDTGPFEPFAFWPLGMPSGHELASIAEKTLVEKRGVVLLDRDNQNQGDGGAVSGGIGYPLVIDNHLHGAVVIEVSDCNEVILQQAMRMLQWGCSWLELLVRRQQNEEDQGVKERLMTVLDLIAITLDQKTFQGATAALTTELANRLQCDRVSLGIGVGQQIKVVAISHSAQFEQKMNLLNAIGLAMEESFDQKTAILFPPAEDGDVFVTRDHEQLARKHGNDNIFSVPFFRDNGFSGVLSYERPRGLSFSLGDIELCESVSALLGAILEDRYLNDRPVRLKVADYCRDQLEKITGPKYFGRKLALAVLVVLAVFFNAATGEYRVTANSKLEGSVRRVIPSPFDGFLAAVSARAGDIVRKDTVLAALDDREATLDRLKWASQREQYAKQYQEAMAQHERAQAMILLAQIRQAEAQMDLADRQLDRKNIIAPFDGIIASGDQYDSLGAAVQKGQVLFEITPLNAYRVIVQVDERDIAEVRTGQTGYLVLSSITDTHFPFRVGTITPITTAESGQNFFRVEAILDQASDQLRPGMEGVAKIVIGERKLLWIWTHTLVDWLKLFTWTWLP
jgi:multidrug resistance efflux pump